MQAKVKTSVRLSHECLSNIDQLIKHYQREYDSLGLPVRITKAQVIEILASEKLKELRASN